MNSWFSCLHSPSARITGACPPHLLYAVLRVGARASCVLSGKRPTSWAASPADTTVGRIGLKCEGSAQGWARKVTGSGRIRLGRLPKLGCLRSCLTTWLYNQALQRGWSEACLCRSWVLWGLGLWCGVKAPQFRTV